jgi:hypothetical protein
MKPGGFERDRIGRETRPEHTTPPGRPARYTFGCFARFLRSSHQCGPCMKSTASEGALT